MKMSGETSGGGRGGQSTLLELWVAIGRLALAGELSLDAVRWGCSVLVVVSSLRRHNGVKTQVARELEKSRRRVRELLGEWEECLDGIALLEELRRRTEASERIRRK